MDFEFSEDQQLLRESVRRFLAEHAPISYVRAQFDDERGSSDEVWRGLAALGVVGLLAPEAHGGAGAGMVDAAVVLEELGRAVHPGPYSSSAIGAVSLVALAGDENDRDDLLPALASGERVGAVAFIGDAQTNRSGDGWALSGAHSHVPDVVAADLLVVAATTDAGELGAFVVECDSLGVEVAATPTVDGTRKHGSVRLSGVPARRLGGHASAAVRETVDRLTIAAVVDGVGAASRALEIAVAYAKDRHQFDRPVGSFQAVQHLCVDMLRAVELARAGAYYASWAADEAGDGERHRAATVAQAYAADELYRVGASLVQVLGGIGFTWEHDAHLYLKRLMTLRQVAGGSSAQLEELASIILD